MLVAARWTRSLGGKRSLAQIQEGEISLLLELLLAQGQEPSPALERGPKRGGKGAQPIDPVLAGEDVLRDLVHHQEQGRVGTAEAQHIADGAYGILRRLRAPRGASAGREPAHRVWVMVGEEPGHHQGEIVLREVSVLGEIPGLAQGLLGNALEVYPVSVTLEGQLEVRHQGVGRAIAEAPLKLAHDGRVDLLVVAGDAAHVEDHGDRVDLATQGGPSLRQLPGARGGIAAQPGLGKRGPVGQRHAIERQPQQLGEAGLA